MLKIYKILNRQTDSHPSAKPPIRSIRIRRIGGRMRIDFLQSANLADGWRIGGSVAATDPRPPLRHSVSPTDEVSPNLPPLIIPRIVSPDSFGPNFNRPAYFVTEPTESPLSIPSPPSGFSKCLSPPFDSSPTPNPSFSLKNLFLYPNTILTTLLSHVFNGLSLKRKAQEDVHQTQFPPKLLKLTSEATVDSSQSITNQKSLAIGPYKSRVRRAPLKKRNSKPNPDPDLIDVTIHNDMTLSSFLHSSQIVV
ncbi:hypothetical protein CsSME_00015661 [Camellia sinensis var. sinensis]